MFQVHVKGALGQRIVKKISNVAFARSLILLYSTQMILQQLVSSFEPTLQRLNLPTLPKKWKSRSVFLK